MTTPLPESLVRAFTANPAQPFCHEIVMDALDLSMALERHALLYGLEGLFLLETNDASWRLPPSRMAWVPAGLHVKATTIRPVRCTSLLFRPDFAPPISESVRVFSAAPVVREMVKHARRWSIEQPVPDEAPEEIERFFRTLLDLCRAHLREAQPQLSLPRAKSEPLRRALAFTQERLDQPIQLDDVAKAVALSPRTLMRRMKDELHMTWRQYIQQARVLRAMEALARGEQVTEVALDIGYSSVAAFSTAFRQAVGMTPTEYQKQL